MDPRYDMDQIAPKFTRAFLVVTTPSGKLHRYLSTAGRVICSQTNKHTYTVSMHLPASGGSGVFFFFGGGGGVLGWRHFHPGAHN